jgi:hypothetical protein
MKRNLLLLTALLLVLGSAQLMAQTVKKPFNGTNLDGWKFNGGWENCWKAGGLNADATTFEIVPLKQWSMSENQADTTPARRRVLNLLPRNQASRPLTRNSSVPQWEPPCLINLVDVNWNKDPRKGVDIYTEEKFGDCTVKLEFLITKGSNSGVYLMGEYEVQIQDSFAKAPNARLGQGDMGAIYSAAAPRVNASGVPGTWQTYEIEFVAPKFNAAGEKTANGVFKKVVLNGVVVQENVEVQGSTGGGVTGREHPTGPLMLQGNHGPVAYRNIEIIVP